jgi:hypothetical protein
MARDAHSRLKKLTEAKPQPGTLAPRVYLASDLWVELYSQFLQLANY